LCTCTTSLSITTSWQLRSLVSEMVATPVVPSVGGATLAISIWNLKVVRIRNVDTAIVEVADVDRADLR
jgi:hypothetical protein